MGKYISDSDFSTTVDHTIDQDVFGNVEMEGILEHLKKSGKSQMFNIGLGGSIYGGVVYHRGAVYFGACDKNVYSLEANSGKQRWRFATDGPICSSPSISGDVLYIGSYDNCIYAISLSGELLWKFQTNGKVASVPLIYNHSVFFGSQDGCIYSVSVDGKLIWKFATNGPVNASAIAHDDVVYIGSHDQSMYALDAATGRLVWRFGTQGQLTTIAEFNNGVIYFGSHDNNLYAVSSAGGKELWRFRASSSIYGRPCVYNGIVYFGSGRGLYAVSTSGEQLWHFSASEFTSATPFVKDGVLFFGSCDNNFYAVDAVSGILVWKFPTNGIITSRVFSMHDDIIYFGSYDCNAYAITTKGELVWKSPTSIGSQSPVYIDGKGSPDTFSFTWRATEESSEKKSEEDREIKDYGEFSGTYMKKDDMSYMSSSKKGYIKKRDF